MQRIKVIFVILSFFVLFCGSVRALDNPIGSPTVPQSSMRSRLIASPEPTAGGNLLVTGNISGGMHFRGIVPYRSTSSFGADLGSTSLDAFLRRSAGSATSDYSGRQQPFYSPSGTVAQTTRRGNILPSSRMDIYLPKQKPSGEKLSGSQPLTQSVSSALEPLPKVTSRPMSTNLYHLEMFLGGLPDQPRTSVDSTDSEVELERFKQSLQEAALKAEQLKRDVTDGTEPSDRSLTETPFGEKSIDSVSADDASDAEGQWDVYKRMKYRVEEFRSKYQNLTDLRKGEEKSEQPEQLEQADRNEVPADDSSRVIPENKLLFEQTGNLGSYETFASYSEDKFNRHLRAAEAYLGEGKYYLAADAYTLASIYKPDNPLAYAGKSHALFAAGEYMSSSLFLARALEIFPEYAAFKIDLEAMVGDKDQLENRIIDIKQWYEKTESAELQFLLAYVSYHMDRLEQAKEAIDGAFGKMSETKAVIVLKEAVDEAFAASKSD